MPDGDTGENPQSGEQLLVLAVCTSLMARAHRLVKQAGELVYCDVTSSLDRFNSPTFIIRTCTAAGGIPLEVAITSEESEPVVAEAISSIKSVLPSDALYGRGERGPQMCITDDSAAE